MMSPEFWLRSEKSMLKILIAGGLNNRRLGFQVEISNFGGGWGAKKFEIWNIVMLLTKYSIIRMW